jgi:EmrB/QacA subfamily drug resistance transporter
MPPLSPATRTLATPLIIACALFMEQLDGSIIATALPAISRSLNADPLHLNLAITSYLFSLAVFIPLSGWVADRIGARTVFRAAIVVFTLGSILCGLSNNLLELVLSRIVQGAGGAMMVPVGRLVLLRTVPKSQLVDAMSWVTAPALIGPVLGPPVGGLIVTYVSWRWIFFVNVPMGILGFILATVYIENIKGRSREPLDKKGFLLMGIALAGLVFGFETIGRGLLSLHIVISLLAVGASCVVLYLLHIKKIEHPIVDLKLIGQYPTYRASVTGGTLVRIGIGALPFLLPLMLQYGFDLSPAASGFLTLASAAGALLMKITATFFIRKFGFKTILLVDTLINTAFLVVYAFFTPNTSHSLMFVALLVGGFFRSIQFTALNTIAFAEIPDALMSRANTLYNMMQQLSLSLGVAVGALLLNLTLAWHHTAQLGAQDFWPAFLVISFLTLVSAVPFLRLERHAGEELTGHRMNPPAPAEHKEPT